MLTFFIITNVWLFWSIAVVDLIILSALVHNERYGYAWFAFMAAFVGYYFLGMFDAGGCYQALRADPLAMLKGTATFAGIYLAAGIAYATFRLVRFVYALKAMYTEEKADYMRRHNTALDSGADRLKWKEYLDSFSCGVGDRRGFHYNVQTGTVTVRVSMYKGRITAWMAYWPFSMLGWFIGDFLADVFETIYKAVSNSYQRIADGIMKGA